MRARREDVERGLMAHGLTAVNGLFRDRDLFIHDGTKLRRFRISAPVQAALFVVLLGLVAWASFATAKFLTRPVGFSSIGAATEALISRIWRAVDESAGSEPAR